MRLLKVMMICLFMMIPSWVEADEGRNVLNLPDGYTLLHISATETLTVEQDLLTASLRFQMEGDDTTKIQDIINKRMKKALDILKEYEGLKYETPRYNISQFHVPRTKIKKWRGTQNLIIKSKESKKVLEIVGKLQADGFLTQSLSYSVSPKRARELQDGMLEQALVKLKTRALRAAKALGKSKADLIEVHTNRSTPRIARNNIMHMSMAETASKSVAPPVAQAGESTLSLTISAKAFLKP